MIYTNPTQGLKYASEELDLSTRFMKPRGVGMAHYHLSIYHDIMDNNDSALFHLERALHFFTLADSEPDQALAYSAMAMHYSDLANFPKALELTDSVINIFNRRNDHYREAVMHGLKADIFAEKGNYLMASYEARKSYQVLDTLDKPIRRAEILRSLAYIENKLGNFETALEYCLKTVPIYIQYADSLALVRVYNEIGMNHYAIGNFGEAERYLDESYIIAKKYKLPQVEASSLQYSGMIRAATGLNREALQLLNTALSIQEELGYPQDAGRIRDEIGMIHMRTGRYDEALEQFNRTIGIFDSIGARADLKTVLKHRSELYQLQQKYAPALSDFQRFHSLHDSLFNVEKSRQIEDMRAIYQAEKREQQIRQQADEIMILRSQARIARLRIILLIAFSLLAVSIMAAIGVYYSQRAKRSKIEREKILVDLEFKEKELTAKALHLASKNELLEGLKNQVKELRSEQTGTTTINSVIAAINSNLRDDNNWENFRLHFESVHKDFNAKLKEEYPDLTGNELRLLALLKMNLSSKEIASILNISGDGIKKARYRLKKKLQLESDESIQDVIMTM